MPIELCDIVPGQRYMHTLTTEQRNGMLQATTEEPKKRIRSVQDCATRVSKEINSGMSEREFWCYGYQGDQQRYGVFGAWLARRLTAVCLDGVFGAILESFL